MSVGLCTPRAPWRRAQRPHSSACRVRLVMRCRRARANSTSRTPTSKVPLHTRLCSDNRPSLKASRSPTRPNLRTLRALSDTLGPEGCQNSDSKSVDSAVCLTLLARGREALNQWRFRRGVLTEPAFSETPQELRARHHHVTSKLKTARSMYWPVSCQTDWKRNEFPR
jgi:hypothetical protein